MRSRHVAACWLRVLCPAVIVPALISGAVYGGGTISVNLTEFAGQALPSDQVYGVASLGTDVSGWVNLNQRAMAMDLAFDDGSLSTVSVQIAAPNWYATGNAAYTGTPLVGFIDDYATTVNPTGMTFADLNYNFPGGYFAVVYLSGYNVNDGASISDGSSTYYFQPVDLRTETWDGTLVQTTTTTDLGAGNAPVAQYAVFGSRESPLASDSITFTLETLYGGGSGIGGVQLVSAAAGPGELVFDVAAGLSQTQGELGYFSISDVEATGVQKTGGGTLVFDGYNTYTGPTTVSAGTLQVNYGEAVQASPVTIDSGATLAVASFASLHTPAVIVDGGTLSSATLAINSTTGVGAVSVNAGTIAGSPTVTIDGAGQMSLAQDARVAVAVGGLSIAETSGGGRLDLGAGQVSVAAGGISASDLRADLIAGRSGGSWNGATGVISSTAAASGGTRTVGYVVATDGSATVSYAAAGDVDLSGAVNVFDLVSVNSSGRYGTGAASVWSQGDFSYDGVTNVFDLVAVNTAGAYGQGNYFPASPTTAGGVAVVPEPSLAGLAVGLAVATLSRVHRRLEMHRRAAA